MCMCCSVVVLVVPIDAGLKVHFPKWYGKEENSLHGRTDRATEQTITAESDCTQCTLVGTI